MNVGDNRGMGVHGPSEQIETAKSAPSTGTTGAKEVVTGGLTKTQNVSLKPGNSPTNPLPLSQGSPHTHLKTQEQGNAVKSFFTSIGKGIKQLFTKSSNRTAKADASKTDKMTQKNNDLGLKSLKDTWNHAGDIGGQGQSRNPSFLSEGKEYTCSRPLSGSGITLQFKSDYDYGIRSGVHIPGDPDRPPLYNGAPISAQNPIPQEFLKAIEQFKNDHPQYG